MRCRIVAQADPCFASLASRATTGAQITTSPYKRLGVVIDEGQPHWCVVLTAIAQVPARALRSHPRCAAPLHILLQRTFTQRRNCARVGKFLRCWPYCTDSEILCSSLHGLPVLLVSSNDLLTRGWRTTSSARKFLESDAAHLFQHDARVVETALLPRAQGRSASRRRDPPPCCQNRCE